MALVETTYTDLSGKLAMTSLKAMLDLHQHKSIDITPTTARCQLVWRQAFYHVFGDRGLMQSFSSMSKWREVQSAYLCTVPSWKARLLQNSSRVEKLKPWSC